MPRKDERVHFPGDALQIPARLARGGVDQLYGRVGADREEPGLGRIRERLDRFLMARLGCDLREVREHIGDLRLRRGRWSSGIDPLANQRDFGGCKMLFLSRRHELIFSLLAAAALEKFYEERVL
jgi:hypothetical protein